MKLDRMRDTDQRGRNGRANLPFVHKHRAEVEAAVASGRDVDGRFGPRIIAVGSVALALCKYLRVLDEMQSHCGNGLPACLIPDVDLDL